MRRKRRGAVVVGEEKGGCALARSWFYFGGILEGVGGVPWVPQWWTRQISSGMLSDTRSVMPQRARITARKARAGDRASKVRSYGCVCQDQGFLGSCLACLRARALSLSLFLSLPSILLSAFCGPTYHAHSLAQYEHQRLVGDGAWVGEEEEAQGDVEEREGGEDRLCGDERHGGQAGARIFSASRRKRGPLAVRLEISGVSRASPGEGCRRVSRSSRERQS